MVVFLIKSIVQCTDELNHKKALKLEKGSTADQRPTLPQADYIFSGACRLKTTPWTSKVADQSTNRWVFLPKNLTCLIFFVGRLEAYLVGQTNCSDRPNMPISTNLSVTGRWLQYNGKINNIGRPTKQISSTDQIFFQSPTSRPFYTSRRRDSSACGIPPYGRKGVPLAPNIFGTSKQKIIPPTHVLRPIHNFYSLTIHSKDKYLLNRSENKVLLP